ncbi:MAG: lysophospholipid acyltransferase family protein [Bryobacteraceae bacterium]|nr:lysophospholipid acyltransferase family protein [Bryobacteraceae bacterium]
MEHLQIQYRAAAGELERIPKAGAAMVVANHPFGILDGLVLGDALLKIRPDVRFLANGLLLAAMPELGELVIPVNPFGGAASANRQGMRAAIDFLGAGGLLVVYPAGEVSHFQWRSWTVMDADWNPSAARMLMLAAKRHGLSPETIPLFVDGSNSALFQMAGMIHSRLRTALLVRELNNKRGSVVRLRVGKPVAFSKLNAMASDAERVDYLRWRTHLLANKHDAPAEGPGIPAIDEVPAPEALMSREVEALQHAGGELGRSGDLAVLLAKSRDIPATLREIGRLREVTFRAAGEGSGRSIDLDRFDDHYLHLFVWNLRKREVVGAYRLATSDCGAKNLYTNTLFQFGNPFLARMGPAIELGRSFVRREYQKSFSPLLLLWKGIGKFIAANPQYPCLFGPVSISNQYHAVSRELMISFLERSARITDFAAFIRPRNAPRRLNLPGPGTACSDLDELADLVSDIETGRTGVPVLLRQYLKLGGRLLGFNIDRQFSNALDGLIVVDLRQTDPKLLERYLGRHEAAAFLSYQKGQYASHTDYQLAAS